MRRDSSELRWVREKRNEGNKRLSSRATPAIPLFSVAAISILKCKITFVTQILKLQRIISYICHLEGNIQGLASELKLGLNFKNLFLSSYCNEDQDGKKCSRCWVVVHRSVEHFDAVSFRVSFLALEPSWHVIPQDEQFSRRRAVQVAHFGVCTTHVSAKKKCFWVNSLFGPRLKSSQRGLVVMSVLSLSSLWKTAPTLTKSRCQCCGRNPPPTAPA